MIRQPPRSPLFPYTPLFRSNICSARRAFALVYAGHAQIVSSDDTNNFFRSEEHTSELQSQSNLVCRLLLEKKKITNNISMYWVKYNDNLCPCTSVFITTVRL